MRSMTDVCHSCVPWHMLRRATFIPLVASVSNISSLHVAGPMVAMIFVRLVLLKPAPVSFQSLYSIKLLSRQKQNKTMI